MEVHLMATWRAPARHSVCLDRHLQARSQRAALSVRHSHQKISHFYTPYVAECQSLSKVAIATSRTLRSTYNCRAPFSAFAIVMHRRSTVYTQQWHGWRAKPSLYDRQDGSRSDN